MGKVATIVRIQVSAPIAQSATLWTLVLVLGAPQTVFIALNKITAQIVGLGFILTLTIVVTAACMRFVRHVNKMVAV